MDLPELGVGVIYVPGLEPIIESRDSLIDVVEIEPQAFWHINTESFNPFQIPQQSIKHIQSFPQPKIIHSVGFAVGGTHKLEQTDIDALLDSIDCFDAVCASEHLSFNHVGVGDKAFFPGFMLPPLQTMDGAICAAETIRAVSKQLPVPFAVETAVNYLKPRKGELSDGEFVSVAVEQADCGILLDLHNIWTNQVNGRQSVEAFLSSIPLDRVWEIHLGGGLEMDGYWLDAHSGSVPEPVMSIAREILPDLPNVKAMMYEIFPAYLPLFGLPAIEKQMEDIKSIWESSRLEKPLLRMEDQKKHVTMYGGKNEVTQIEPYQWEQTLGEMVTGNMPQTPLSEELSYDNGIYLLRKLVWKFRAGSIVKVMPLLSQLIMIQHGKETLDKLLDDYFNVSKPKPFASEECYGFIDYLRKIEHDIAYLQDILNYEEALIWSNINQKATNVVFMHDPRVLLSAIIDSNIPDTINSGYYELPIEPEELEGTVNY